MAVVESCRQRVTESKSTGEEIHCTPSQTTLLLNWPANLASHHWFEQSFVQYSSTIHKVGVLEFPPKWSLIGFDSCCIYFKFVLFATTKLVTECLVPVISVVVASLQTQAGSWIPFWIGYLPTKASQSNHASSVWKDVSMYHGQ